LNWLAGVVYAFIWHNGRQEGLGMVYEVACVADLAVSLLPSPWKPRHQPAPVSRPEAFAAGAVTGFKLATTLLQFVRGLGVCTPRAACSSALPSKDGSCPWTSTCASSWLSW
jgi:hypothetical protein